MRTGVIWLALLGSLSVAHADAADDNQQAREHYEEANAQYRLGNYAKAAKEFETSFELRHDPALLYNAAQAHRLGGNKRRALLLYQTLLRLYADKLTDPAEVRRHIADLSLAIQSDEKSQSSPSVVTLSAGATGSAPEPSAPPEPPAPVASPPPSVVVAAPAPPPRPLVKRRWLWGTVAGAVVVAGAAVALGVTLGSTSARDPQSSLGRVQAN
jgi:hypothetical protein